MYIAHLNLISPFIKANFSYTIFYNNVCLKLLHATCSQFKLCCLNQVLGYVVVGELCAWFIQYNSSCKHVARDSFRQRRCIYRARFFFTIRPCMHARWRCIPGSILLYFFLGPCQKSVSTDTRDGIRRDFSIFTDP